MFVGPVNLRLTNYNDSFLYYLLPNLERLNYRPRASYNLASSLGDVLGSAAYGTAYAALMILMRSGARRASSKNPSRTLPW